MFFLVLTGTTWVHLNRMIDHLKNFGSDIRRQLFGE
jgi:hypothetical protein